MGACTVVFKVLIGWHYLNYFGNLDIADVFLCANGSYAVAPCIEIECRSYSGCKIYSWPRSARVQTAEVLNW